MPKGTVLVVGGAGFIGSHVNLMLHEAGYDTLVLDNLSRGFSEAVVKGTFIKGDMQDASLLRQLFSKHHIDAVMHFASYIDVGESVKDPLKYYMNNVSGTLQLLSIMRDAEINIFIFSSSASVYGIPTTPIVDENHPRHPVNPYGRTKLFIEEILKDIEFSHGIKHCSLRYFNAAGGDPKGMIKNFRLDESNLIPKILRHIQRKQPIKIYGTDYPTPDGTCVRDYIHVIDLANAHIVAMERLLNGAPSDAYNLGNGQGYSVKEILHTIDEVVGQAMTILEDARRLGDPPFLVADSSKARKHLNWQPQRHIKEIITDAWQAMQV